MTKLVHRDEPTWFDPDTGDVTHALDRDSKRAEEIAHLEATGMFDPRHLRRIPQDDGDGTAYNPEIVTRILEAAEGPSVTFWLEHYLELLQQRRNA